MEEAEQHDPAAAADSVHFACLHIDHPSVYAAAQSVRRYRQRRANGMELPDRRACPYRRYFGGRLCRSCDHRRKSCPEYIRKGGGKHAARRTAGRLYAQSSFRGGVQHLRRRISYTGWGYRTWSSRHIHQENAARVISVPSVQGLLPARPRKHCPRP